MLSCDIKGIYLPVALLMLGLSQILVSQCASEPNCPNATGPSATSMVCFFYFIFHLLVWLPLGVFLVVAQFRRYTRSTILPDRVFYTPSSSDKARTVICSMICCFITLVSFLILRIPSDTGAIFLLSLIFNIVPAFIFFLIGTLLTKNRRARIREADQ